MVLVAVVLPLAVLAGLAMGIRIGQYGWTPERIWGAIAVGGCAQLRRRRLVGGRRGRRNFDELLRPLQTRLAIGLCGLAVLLALPILDFGAISARSQIARLERGAIDAEKFDWAAMAFDFGPAGRKRLARACRPRPRRMARARPPRRWDRTNAMRSPSRPARPSTRTRSRAGAAHPVRLTCGVTPELAAAHRGAAHLLATAPNAR